MKTKNLSKGNENLVETEVESRNVTRLKLFLAVIIMLLALNMLIGGIMLVLSIFIDMPHIYFFLVPEIIISILSAIYAAFVAVFLLRGKKKTLIKILLVLLLSLLFIWLFWRVFFFCIFMFSPFGLDISSMSYSIIDLIFSLTAIISTIIYLIKN